MARILGRSRSLRMLRGGHKETHQREDGAATPLPSTSQADTERLKAASPVTKADTRVDTPDMLQRPKTSGGPGDRSTLFHKKVAPSNPGPDNQTFTFPFISPSKSNTTVLYAAEVHEDPEEGIIGIALGSPTMNSHWNNPTQASDYVSNNSGTITQISSVSALPETAGPKTEAPKQKLSRWKSIFGRKQQQQQAPAAEQKPSFYQLAQSVIPARADSHHDEDSIDSPATRVEEPKEEPRSVSPPVFRPEIRESRKGPKSQEYVPVSTRPRALTIATNSQSKPKTSLMRSASSPKPPPKDAFLNSPIVPQLVLPGTGPSGSPSNGRSPLLDVDIPSIKMERYSVMFGSLLQSNPGNRQSSLLTRRQGNSERLKPLNELTVKKEGEEPRNGSVKPQRRATSPSFSKSPGLSLFPAPTSNQRAPSPRAMSVHRPRPLQRSRTAPAVSPSRQSFDVSAPAPNAAKEATKEKVVEEHKPKMENLNSTSQLLTPTPSSRNSFDSDSEEVSVVAGHASGATWKPRMDEPEWEIISKPAQASLPSQRTALSSHPASAAMEEGPASAPLVSRAESNTPKTQMLEPAPRSADMVGSVKSQSPKPLTQTKDQNEVQGTTVGVARSVSVSRASPRSAELLKPTLVRRATERSISPGPSGRLIDQKPLTPTLVELKNRKSQRVQLVDA